MNLNQLQSPITSGISFMRDPIVENELQHKDPAVVAVSSVPNNYPYHQYGVQTSDQLVPTQMTNSIPNSNNSINPQKVSTYENVSAIPTQTYTNQSFAAIMPGGGGTIVSVPVTGPFVHSIPIQGIVPQDLGSHPLTSSDLGVGQSYGTHQNFLDSNQDNKHQTSSQERGSNFQNDDTNGFRNNRMRGRGGYNARTNQTNNMNGYGNRPRNGNKGTGILSINY